MSSTVRLVLILFVAFLLRIFFIDHQSLWLDELASWSFASLNLHGVLASEPTNPPVYYLLLHFWMQLFGASEAAMRSLSVVPSMFSVWLVYRLASRILDARIATIAAVYMAVSSFQIYYAQEARCFALLTAEILLAGVCLWEALEAESVSRRRGFFLAYALLGGLALYTHFIALFFLAGFGLFVLVRRTRSVWEAGAATAVSLALFFPWLRVMLGAASRGQVRHYLMLKFPQAYFSFLFGDSLIPLDDQAVHHIAQTLAQSWWILAAAVFGVGALALYFIPAWKRHGDRWLFFLWMALVPVVLAFLVSFKIMLFDERYLIAASPFLYVAIAGALAEGLLAARPRVPALLAASLFVVLLGLSLVQYYFNPRFSKEQWREAVAYIDSTDTPAARAFVVLDPDYLDFCYRYYQKKGLPYLRTVPKLRAEIAASPDALAARAAGYQTVTLVRSHADNDLVIEALRQRFRETSAKEFPAQNGIWVYTFERLTP